MKLIVKTIKIVLGTGLLFGLYILAMIAYASIRDYKPAEKITISPVGNGELLLPDTLTFFNWNIGYAGLGKEVDFFYDGGKTVVSPIEVVQKDIAGIVATIIQNKTDFVLLQEVDENSKRSYYTEQDRQIAAALPGYVSAMAINYDVKFVPIPFTRPMGKVLGGLVTLGKYKPIECVRYQYPSAFPWPKNLFMLDRCMMVERFPIADGKELLVINLHNSAYDDTGELKRAEMNYLKTYIMREYENGNYLVIGGDWNQTPPGFDNNSFKKPNGEEAYVQEPIAVDYIPANWKWVYDEKTPTNRKLASPYNPQETFTTVIDFYLLSPNVALLDKKGISLDFDYSDHQPVWMKVALLR